MPSIRAGLVWGIMGWLALASIIVAQDSRIQVEPSQWWSDVEKVEDTLRSGKWKSGAKKAQRLVDEVVRKSWRGPELKKVLSRLALLQAIAEANLGKDREAIWHWHVACNLDFRVRKTDFSGWGEAGKLLLEYPLRKRGGVPVGFDPLKPALTDHVRPPAVQRQAVPPVVLENTGAALDHRGDLEVEVIVDQDGVLHHPVVLSELNPVIVYATLQSLFERKPFIPGTVNGEARDFVFDITVQYHVERW